MLIPVDKNKNVEEYTGLSGQSTVSIYLKSLCSVDGSERSEHSQYSQNLYHRDGT